MQRLGRQDLIGGLAAGAACLALSSLPACNCRSRIVPKPARSAPVVTFDSPATCPPSSAGRTFDVGPGKPHANIGDVPLETLAAGDTVRVFARPEPYREKVLISGRGKKDAPIRFCGVKGAGGELPVLDGKDAKTRAGLPFPFDGHQPRGLVIVGWRRGDPWQDAPEHIEIAGFEIRNASPAHEFTDKDGKRGAYAENAAGIYVQRARHVTLRGNVVHDNGNGLFVGGGGAEELTSDVLIEGNYVYQNGSSDSYLQHNVYNEAARVTYQYNHFGPPRSGPQGTLGGNVKERSAGVVLRYNWIEDGAHLLDLVDAQEAREPNLKDESFRHSWVYGNVFVRGPVANGSMIHYGGDSGVLETYRKGVLHFFHNTVAIENASHGEYQGTSIFELSTNDETLESRNNLFVSEEPSHRRRVVVLLGARDGVAAGQASFRGDWLTEGTLGFDAANKKVTVQGKIDGLDALLKGTTPGFVDFEQRKLELAAGSSVRGKGHPFELPTEHAVAQEYAGNGVGRPRPADDPPTPGAFAR